MANVSLDVRGLRCALSWFMWVGFLDLVSAPVCVLRCVCYPTVYLDFMPDFVWLRASLVSSPFSHGFRLMGFVCLLFGCLTARLLSKWKLRWIVDRLLCPGSPCSVSWFLALWIGCSSSSCASSCSSTVCTCSPLGVSAFSVDCLAIFFEAGLFVNIKIVVLV